jgi:hypothetical protein
MTQSFVARTHQVRSALLCGTNGVWHRCFVGELERPHRRVQLKEAVTAAFDHVRGAGAGAILGQ